MKIADSNLVMKSHRSYEENSFKARLYSGRADNLMIGEGSKGGNVFSGMMVKNRNIRTEADVMSDMRRVRMSLLSIILERLGKSRLTENVRFMSTGIGMGSFQNPMMQEISMYEEYEDTCFETSGIVHTEDGRTIDFGMQLSMSRAFIEYTRTDVPSMEAFMIDPLVINIDSPVAHVSDQKFRFDLDCDGIEEEISRLGSGSGFLALDKNGDGVINDGSELFGAASGDGFRDLAEYDSDNNGWIDENDPIFKRLKVWYTDPEGKEVLMCLKDADVGAINLGSAETSFTMKDADQNTLGTVRKTGVFLKESGGVGSVQHVDLAVKRNEYLRAYGA